MTPTDAMVEKVARALAPLAWAALGLADTLAHQNRRKASLKHARVAIAAYEAALNEAGLVVAPREPTQEMQIKGLEALIPNLKEVENHVEKLIGDGHKWPWMTVGISLGNSNVTDAIYRAMLAAAAPELR